MANANADDALPPKSTGTVMTVDPIKSCGTILVDNNVNNGVPVWFLGANFPKGTRVIFDLKPNKLKPEEL